jgi:hypothetical protein
MDDHELREALLNGDEGFRSQVLWHLGRWSKEQGGKWADLALPFLRNVWPKQRSIQSEAMSASLVDLCLNVPRHFDEMVDSVVHLLVPISGRGTGFFQLDRNEQHIAWTRPKALLKLIHAALPERASDWPYGATQVVERLASEPTLADDPRLVELRLRLAAR